MEKIANQIMVNFEEDSDSSVSLETALTLMTIVGAPSLEALIQHALIKLKGILEIAYPPDGGLPTAEHLAAIARQAPQDLQLTGITSLFDEKSGKNSVTAKEYNLDELMSAVTEGNKHERIALGNPVGRELL